MNHFGGSSTQESQDGIPSLAGVVWGSTSLWQSTNCNARRAVRIDYHHRGYTFKTRERGVTHTGYPPPLGYPERGSKGTPVWGVKLGQKILCFTPKMLHTGKKMPKNASRPKKNQKWQKKPPPAGDPKGHWRYPSSPADPPILPHLPPPRVQSWKKTLTTTATQRVSWIPVQPRAQHKRSHMRNKRSRRAVGLPPGFAGRQFRRPRGSDVVAPPPPKREGWRFLSNAYVYHQTLFVQGRASLSDPPPPGLSHRLENLGGLEKGWLLTTLWRSPRLEPEPGSNPVPKNLQVYPKNCQ